MKWLASGITNAIAAESEISDNSEKAKEFINRAIYCFKQANNDSFKRKADIQSESITLRLKYFNAGRTGSFLQADEKEVVELFEKVLKENLLIEVVGLGKDIDNMLQSSKLHWSHRQSF